MVKTAIVNVMLLFVQKTSSWMFMLMRTVEGGNDDDDDNDDDVDGYGDDGDDAATAANDVDYVYSLFHSSYKYESMMKWKYNDLFQYKFKTRLLIARILDASSSTRILENFINYQWISCQFS